MTLELNSDDKTKMHVLQPKQTKLSEEETKKILNSLNISKSQLPKIISTDISMPEGVVTGDVIRIERKEDEKINFYYRVVI
jgi:DNA-directed RNA polymerase subunit H (RpoH/RPB5)